MNYASMTALGRAQVALCEQLAWLALESFERAHRMNMDALESFWERRIGEAKAVTGIEPARLRFAPTPALLEQWIRIGDTAAYLNGEFGRVACEYVGELQNVLFPERVALGLEPAEHSKVETERQGILI